MRNVTIAGAMFTMAAGMAHAQQVDLEGGILPYEDEAAVALGASIYEDNCASCHGAELEGQPNWQDPGPNGRRPAPPHDATGHTWHHPDSQLFLITKFGIEALVGGDYKSDMPGFKEVLNDQEILDVLAFIKSTWPDRVIETHNKINADQ
ncbi:MAG: cytochrome c [Rhodobacteraceae bacterium]|nr:cytochrome c [Paracoccaceae bacterium]